MAYPTSGNTGPLFRRLDDIANDCSHLRREAQEILGDLKPVVIGQRVERHGRVYQIVDAHVGLSGNVVAYGVTVNRKGKVGSRGFDLGNLVDCKFIDKELAR
jgi:hypothetical protein